MLLAAAKKQLHPFLICVTIVLVKTSVFPVRTKGGFMDKNGRYYIVKEKALPEVLLKVVEARRLIESEKAMTVQEATDTLGISRSSFYKYKDDIIPFHEHIHGRTITLSVQLDDKPGLLSGILGRIAEVHANILTIHQAIPINGVASLTLSIDILPTTGDFAALMDGLKAMEGVHDIKILARE